MIEVRLAWVPDHMATAITIETFGKTNESVGILVDDRPMPPWWNLHRRWLNRQYRLACSRMFAYSLDYDLQELDDTLREMLTKREVALA